MKKHNRKYTTKLVLALAILFPAISFSQAKVGSTIPPPPFEVTNSPRAIGMGGASITLVDEQSALHNPAAPGLYHLSNIFGASLPNSRTHALNKTPLKSWNLSAGYSLAKGKNSYDQESRFTIAGSFAREVNEQPLGGLQGNFSYRSINIYALALAIDKGIRLGVGASYRQSTHTFSVQSTSYSDPTGQFLPQIDFTREFDSYDFGIILEAPLHRILFHENESASFSQKSHLELTPSLAFVRAATGGSYSAGFVSTAPEGNYQYPTGHGSPETKVDNQGHIRLIGAGLLLALVKNNHSSFSLLVTAERETTILDTRGSSSTPRDRMGFELGFYDAMHLRTGVSTNLDLESDFGIIDGAIKKIKRRFYTFGFGLRASGLLKLLSANRNSGDGSLSIGPFHGLDFTIDYGNTGNDRSVLKASLSMRR